MSWIAEYDTQGREFPTCVHVTKTTHTMTHGATYVPIEDGKALRDENAKLRELVRDMWLHSYCSIAKTREDDDRHIEDVIDRMRELGVDA